MKDKTTASIEVDDGSVGAGCQKATAAALLFEVAVSLARLTWLAAV